MPKALVSIFQTIAVEGFVIVPEEATIVVFAKKDPAFVLFIAKVTS